MSLRLKVLMAVVTIVGLYGVVEYTVQRRVIFPSFVRLEREKAETDLRRCVSAIEREIQQLGTSAGDYGGWDDTAQFVVDGNQKYIDINLNLVGLKGLGINLLCVCNPQGKIIGLQTLDLATQEAVTIPDFQKESFPTSHVLLQLKKPNDAIGGIMVTGKGPMLLASRPVLNNEREGPVRGAVIMGRFLNEDLVAKLREQTQIQFEILPALPNLAPPSAKTASRTRPQDIRIQIDDRQPDTMNVSATLLDLNGNPALPIKAVIPREITARGRGAMRFANYSIVTIGLVVLVALLVFLQSMVLGPVTKLTNHVVHVGKTDDLTARLRLNSRDEIGTLATEFDHMVKNLADARQKLVEQSYESGIAEMASGTLHNVSNALTPVLVELDMLQVSLKQAPVDQIDQARQQLKDESVPESRRRDLERFLDLAGEKLLAVARETHTKLGDVAGRARQIEQFLADQGHASRADRPMEWVGVADLVQDAAKLLPVSLRERLSVEIGPGLAKLGSWKTHRTCLLQVFGNLLTNAAEAIAETGETRGTILVDAAVEDAAGAATVHLWVRDHGVGIAPENLGRVFNRNFTTKGEMARGLGLHWCANSVNGMQGRMYAESDGVGRGACLHVILPKVA